MNMITGKHQQCLQQPSQAGFTIIESLVAIMVVSILMLALSPVIVLAVATRVQARRVELGTQAARAYIDGVRSGAISAAPQITKDIDFPAPSSGSLTCDKDTHVCDPLNSLYCVPANPGNTCTVNSVSDMVVQASGYNQTATGAADDYKRGYLLRVRVYRADAFKESKLKTLAKDQAKAQTFTGGLGDRTSPLAEMTTEIPTTVSKNAFSNLCNRLYDPKNTNSVCK